MARLATRISFQFVFFALLWLASLQLTYAISDLRGARETKATVERVSDFVLERYHEELKAHTWMAKEIQGDDFMLESGNLKMRFRFDGYKTRPCTVNDLPFTGSWLIVPSAVVVENGEKVVVGEALKRGMALSEVFADAGILTPVQKPVSGRLVAKQPFEPVHAFADSFH